MSKVLRVIVADDEPDLLETCRAMLAFLGHEVVATAHNGEQLIEKCRAKRPDLIITDIKMPGKDGIQAVLEVFRETPVRVILVTGYHAPEHIHDALGRMVLAYLAKPFGENDLAAAIQRAEQRFTEFQALLDGHGDPQQAVKNRELLRLAKGVLIKRSSLNDRDAFLHLQRLAQQEGRSLIEIARQMVSAERADQPEPRPSSPSNELTNCV
jgi:AmiR/NasT family two-component response regulator